MIVSTNWLADYVDLPKDLEDLTDRLTLTGLNLEGIESVGDDTAIDLEVTSNRPDCLGHIGVAREIAVIWGKELKKEEPSAPATGGLVSKVTTVTVNCPDLCSRYTARVIKGVKIGPSPEWLASRLRTLGIAVINNVVDITNYVMMEIGQPLHAFDLAKLDGGILVRRATAGEEFTAIDHKTYKLSGEEVVIADSQRPVALGGVMGGADTEVSESTVDLLIEAADFDCMAVRGAARRHVLHSPSSYRFERGVDPEGIDWASRRCCELILELAGGELCEGMLDVAQPQKRKFDGDRDDIKLRFAQVPRVLGMDVPVEETRRILTELGCSETHCCEVCVKTVPPTWRADLTREADLIEEVARIYGYDKIPTTTSIGLVPSAKRREDVVLDRVRTVMVAAGFDEAYTLSAVEIEQAAAFHPWTDADTPALTTSTSVLRRASALRQTLVPSLLTCRRTNETLSNPVVELFEIAKVYLPQQGELPDERRVLAITSGGGFLEIKGVIESLVGAIAPSLRLATTATEHDLLDSARCCELMLGTGRLGVMGELSQSGLDRFDLRGATSVAEIDLAPLVDAAELVRSTAPLSSYPPVTRDLNVVVSESTPWAQIEQIAAQAAGPIAELITFQDDTFRDPKQLGEGAKSVVFRVQLRSPEGTLTSNEADEIVKRMVAQLRAELGAQLRAG